MMRSITQAELASRVSITPSFLSQIEKNKNTPSLFTLKKIASCLDVPINLLITDSSNSDPRELVRKSERTRIVGLSNNNVMLEYLTDSSPTNNIEACIHILQPFDTLGSVSNSHAGQEVWYLLEGSVNIKVGDTVESMEEGDCFYVRDCNVPHKFSNRSGERIARMLCITSPPFFQGREI